MSWLENWKNKQISNTQKFTLTAQIDAALVCTLRCHAELIDDLLPNGQEFVLTARYQSDPIERRFGKYRHMSGERFLISEKDINISEKTLKIKALINEGVEVASTVLSTEENPAKVEKVAELVGGLQLNDVSRQVSDNVVGYIIHKTVCLYSDC